MVLFIRHRISCQVCRGLIVNSCAEAVWQTKPAFFVCPEQRLRLPKADGVVRLFLFNDDKLQPH
jgi:hypothetical protein